MRRVDSQTLFCEKQHFGVVFDHIIILTHFFKMKKRALNFGEDWSKNQPMNSDLKPFRTFLDNVGTKKKNA